MKYLSRVHLQKLEELKKEQLLLECVERLESLSLPHTFPPKREEYYTFAEHIYRVAQKYGLKEKRGLFALLTAWHLKGDAICQTHPFVTVLSDTTLSSLQKCEFFEKYILDTISTEEEA